MISDVVAVAWRAVGSPKAGPATGREGVCARCGVTDDLTPVRAVVSRNFTGYDDWRYPWRDGLCRACSWAYQAPLLRSLPHLVVRRPELLMPLSSFELGTALARALADDTAVVVPLRPGRKHVVSGAMWGHVVTDDALLSWTSADVGRLGVVDELRAAGFPGRSLLQPAPPYRPLQALPPNRYPEVLRWWADLQPWRDKPAWLQVACKTGPRTASSR